MFWFSFLDLLSFTSNCSLVMWVSVCACVVALCAYVRGCELISIRKWNKSSAQCMYCIHNHLLNILKFKNNNTKREDQIEVGRSILVKPNPRNELTIQKLHSINPLKLLALCNIRKRPIAVLNIKLFSFWINFYCEKKSNCPITTKLCYFHRPHISICVALIT